MTEEEFTPLDVDTEEESIEKLKGYIDGLMTSPNLPTEGYFKGGIIKVEYDTGEIEEYDIPPSPKDSAQAHPQNFTKGATQSAAPIVYTSTSTEEQLEKRVKSLEEKLQLIYESLAAISKALGGEK